MEIKFSFPIRVFDSDRIIDIHNMEDYQNFSSRYAILHAAGGIVLNEAGKVLMIYRRGRWDFPKGKVEPFESIPEAAIREVMEETGLSDMQIEQELPFTFHIYHEKELPILKSTAWFKMSTTAMNNLHPQLEEDIIEVRWVSQDKVSSLLCDSYSSLRDLWGYLVNQPDFLDGKRVK